MRFLVMDHTGHSTEQFDRASEADLATALERFDSLVKSGHRAAVRTGDGESRLLRALDPTAEEVLFIPHLKGG